MSASPPVSAPAGPAAPATAGALPLPAGGPRSALVVFCDATDLPWLRLLKPGFRHVFVALADGPHWITLDPLSPHTEVAVQPVPAGFDLAGWFREQGLVVVEAAVARGHRRPAPFGPFTCVEAVKRVLGLHAPFILTPFQLYRRLTTGA